MSNEQNARNKFKIELPDLLQSLASVIKDYGQRREPPKNLYWIIRTIEEVEEERNNHFVKKIIQQAQLIKILDAQLHTENRSFFWPEETAQLAHAFVNILRIIDNYQNNGGSHEQ